MSQEIGDRSRINKYIDRINRFRSRIIESCRINRCMKRANRSNVRRKMYPRNKINRFRSRMNKGRNRMNRCRS